MSVMMTRNKDESIEALLHRLDSVLGSEAYQVVDHWDGDRFAIGIVSPTDPRRLVYVSTHEQAKGRYFFECEEPAGEADDDYQVADTGEQVTFETLVQAIRSHFSRTRS